MTQLIIFSDLDGTLLDHETYAWTAAAPALAALRSNAVALVVASSKTAAEIAPLRAELGFSHCPAIVENGAGVLEPGDPSGDRDDRAYRAIRAKLTNLPDKWHGKFEGFGDWTVDEIANRTGLTLQKAALAGERQFSEPGLWHGGENELHAFSAWLEEDGITMRRGGRFITLSLGTDKAQAMASIAGRLQHGAARPVIVALGDAPNDIGMLQAADIGFIVKNPHAETIPQLSGERDGRIGRTHKAGPAGWNDAVLSVLKDHGYAI